MPPSEGLSRLNFVGTFTAQSGERTQVDTTVTPLHDGKDAGLDLLRLSRVGPFHHPFVSQGEAETGVFEGQVYVVTVPFDGAPRVGAPMEFQLEIKPSIAIETWEPVVANCGVPALRGLGGLAYFMKVRAIGFEPVRFRYVLGQTNGEAVVLIEHDATGATDEVGTPEQICSV